MKLHMLFQDEHHGSLRPPTVASDIHKAFKNFTPLRSFLFPSPISFEPFQFLNDPVAFASLCKLRMYGNEKFQNWMKKSNLFSHQFSWVVSSGLSLLTDSAGLAKNHHLKCFFKTLCVLKINFSKQFQPEHKTSVLVKF